MTRAAQFKPATARVVAALSQAGLSAEVVVVDETARTAEGAAAAIGTGVGQIVKSLVFMSDGCPVLALVSGANRLDTAKLAAETGGTITRADAQAVCDATGYAIGGIPPLGHANPLATFCDRDLLGYETVWAAAGTPDTVFAVRPDTLVAATAATVCDLAAAATPTSP
jgi:prolyl-tRNA editing enzyme YbaK/EbsC (Cys-tRNA(Pro) deacylase)